MRQGNRVDKYKINSSIQKEFFHLTKQANKCRTNIKVNKKEKIYIIAGNTV